MLIAVIAVAVGIAVGYGFRGYISRTKSAAGTALKTGVTKEVSKL